MKRGRPTKKSMADFSRDMAYRNLITLGDMMGDGLHHEDPSISREYTKALKSLEPEIFRERRKNTNKKRDESMKVLLDKFNCSCGGKLSQSRKGSYVAYCKICNKRYKATSKKK